MLRYSLSSQLRNSCTLSFRTAESALSRMMICESKQRVGRWFWRMERIRLVQSMAVTMAVTTVVTTVVRSANNSLKQEARGSRLQEFLGQISAEHFWRVHWGRELLHTQTEACD